MEYVFYRTVSLKPERQGSFCSQLPTALNRDFLENRIRFRARAARAVRSPRDMVDTRHDAFHVASPTDNQAAVSKRAFREKFRKKSRRNKEARKFVVGFGEGPGDAEFAEDADESFHAPSACGILLLVLLPLLASALLTALRAKDVP